MKDPLLEFYERELSFIREEGSEFARRYPKIAGRLRIADAENIEDPHVSRLIEAFALLCARLRLKIEDEFPEICQSFIQALYPQYIAPIPPASICQFRLADNSLDSSDGRTLARGTRIETEEVDGIQCEFRSCYETQLLPIAIEQADYVVPPFPFDIENSWRSFSQAAIRLRLRSRSSKLSLSQIKLSKLRLYLGGSTALGNELYEAFFRNATGFLLTSSNGSSISFPKNDIRPVGFSSDEGLLNNDARTLHAYSILWDFFTCPEKYRFVDLEIGSKWKIATESSSYIDLIVPLRRPGVAIQRDLKPDTIRLGCSPVVNLFSHIAEPFRLSDNKSEYRIVPSARNPKGLEIISIDQVTVSSPGGGEQRKFKPFFLPSHHQQASEQELYWHSSRRRRLAEETEGDRGTEIYLTFVDLQSRPHVPDEWTVHVETTCCNRDLVGKLPFGVGRPKVNLRSGAANVSAEFLIPPTPTLRPIAKADYFWRLISHLSMNHLSLANDSAGAGALREILTLYNSNQNEETNRAIQGIVSVRYERTVGRLTKEAGAGFCRGISIDLTVDEERLVGMGNYLFASVMDNFFSLFASINSFTRLTVRASNGTEPFYVGPARAGERFVL